MSFASQISGRRLMYEETTMKMVPYNGREIKVGMVVTRVLAGVVTMPLEVTEVTSRFVTCDWWHFDRATGAEVDEELGWDTKRTGSVLTEMQQQGES